MPACARGQLKSNWSPQRNARACRRAACRRDRTGVPGPGYGWPPVTAQDRHALRVSSALALAAERDGPAGSSPGS
jgi:hypothetical protein